MLLLPEAYKTAWWSSANKAEQSWVQKQTKVGSTETKTKAVLLTIDKSGQQE